MAKTASVKKNAQSIHSRAAKRASSPGIDLDKSLKDLPRTTETSAQKSAVLAIHQGAGVTKKGKHGRKSVLSARAKRRQEKGLDRAEAVMDKKEIKVAKSKGKARTIQERSKAWDEQNRKMMADKAKFTVAEADSEGWVDENIPMPGDEEVEMDDAPSVRSASGAFPPLQPAVPEEDDDEVM